jgi:hypothetical protein
MVQDSFSEGAIYPVRALAALLALLAVSGLLTAL